MEWLKENNDNTDAGEDMEKLGPSHTTGGTLK